MSNNFENQARDIIKKATAYTSRYATASIYDNGQRLTRFANSEIHQNVEIEDMAISLTVYDGKKEATCSSNNFNDESLKKLAADADSIVELLPDGEFEPLPPPMETLPVTENDERLAAAFDVTKRAEAIKRCVSALDKDYTAAGALSLDRDMYALGDNKGLFHYYSMDSVNLELVVTHKDGATGYGGFSTNKLEECDVEKAFKTAYEKAKAARNPVSVPLGAYTVILEPAAVADLIAFLLYGLNGEDYLAGSSYAAGKLGQRVLGENITIMDDVNDPRTYRRYFDYEGYRRTPLDLIRNGVIANVLHDSKTARKSGGKITGHAASNKGNGGYPCNVIMSGGDSSMEDMIANTKKGILVTHFHYTNHVNEKTAQVTGLTRDGTFLVENGKVTGPVVNMRFTESMINAFNNVTALSKNLEKIPFIGGVGLFPAAVIEDFHFTSKQS